MPNAPLAATRPEVGVDQRPRGHGIEKMPAGQDEELAALFRDLRNALNASPEALARQLDTTTDVIEALEAGALLALPAWPETDRIITAYAALLGLDGRPILRRIVAHFQAYAPDSSAEPDSSAGQPAPDASAPAPKPPETHSFSLPSPQARPAEPQAVPPRAGVVQPQAGPVQPQAGPVEPQTRPEQPQAWPLPPQAKPAQPQHVRPRPEAALAPSGSATASIGQDPEPAKPPNGSPPRAETRPPARSLLAPEQVQPETDAAFDDDAPGDEAVAPPPIPVPPGADASSGPQSKKARTGPRASASALKRFAPSTARILAFVGMAIAIWLIAGNSDRLMSGMPEPIQWLARGVVGGGSSDDPRSRKADRLPSRY